MAGLGFAVVAVLGLVFLVPWIAERKAGDYELEAEQDDARFSQSLRILRSDVLEYNPDEAEVSTPLTRKAQLAELTMIAQVAARRRRRTLLALSFVLVTLSVGWVFGALPWWSVLIPLGLIASFLGIARFSVVAMHRDLDARAAQIIEGWRSEDTSVLELRDEEESVRLELSMEMSGQGLGEGSLWDPIPVTTPTYVSAPLAPRTVRTIDLSAPLPDRPIVPTADALETETYAGEQQRPRVVNE